jgi:tetratricopeptide (TPR) repeat protein
MHRLFLMLTLALPQQAEELAVEGPTPAVCRLGASARVNLAVTGPNANPRPPKLPQVDGLQLALTPMSTSSFQSFSLGGRIHSEQRVSCAIVITPLRVGRFTIPAFPMHTGTREQTVPAMTLEVVKDIGGKDHAFVAAKPASARVYVNEPIRVTIEYGVDAGLRLERARAQNGQEYYDVELQCPWLDELPGTVPIESAAPERDNVWLVLNRRLLSVVYTPNVEHAGRAFHGFRVTRSFLPTRSGTIDLPGPVLRFAVVTEEPRRGFFGERVGGRSEEHFAYAEPATIEVLPIPEAGRPASYTGGVGRFALRASVDRARVKVGDSIKLTLTVEGDGNLEFLGLPTLGDLAGFHRLGSNENRSAGRASITYDITPLSTDANVIPAVPWSWFDTTPGVERFVEASTEPIPIDVSPLPESGSLAPLPGADAGAVVAGVDDIFDIKPVGDGGERVLRDPPSAWVAVALSVAPWLCAGLGALWLRRRRAALRDTAGRRARGAFAAFRKAVERAGDPTDALVAYVAARLATTEAAVIGPDLGRRLAAAGVDEDLAREVQRAIDRGVAARYGGGSGLERRSAEDVVARLENQPIGARAGKALLLVLALGAAAGHGTAQDSAAAAPNGAVDPVAAYRRGDYAGAARGFAALSEEHDADRRSFYNLGNSLYRQGRYAEALYAYERARLGMPRDPELDANIALVERRLGLGSAEGEPFAESLMRLRERFTPGERMLLTVLANALAAGLVVFGRRRLRAVGLVVALPALVLALDTCAFAPARPLRAVVLAPRVDVVAEPRDGLEPVAKVRQGVTVEVLRSGSGFTLVRAGERHGYVRSDAIGIVR